VKVKKRLVANDEMSIVADMTLMYKKLEIKYWWMKMYNISNWTARERPISQLKT
jgi:hypothetical protein